MSIHDTPAYCTRCGGTHTGRKGAHCKQGPVQPAVIIGNGVRFFRGPQVVNEFSRNEFAEGREDVPSGWQ